MPPCIGFSHWHRDLNQTLLIFWCFSLMPLLSKIGVGHICTVPKSGIEAAATSRAQVQHLTAPYDQVSCFHTNSNCSSVGQQPPVTLTSSILSTTAFPCMHAVYACMFMCKFDRSKLPHTAAQECSYRPCRPINPALSLAETSRALSSLLVLPLTQHHSFDSDRDPSPTLFLVLENRSTCSLVAVCHIKHWLPSS